MRFDRWRGKGVRAARRFCAIAASIVLLGLAPEVCTAQTPPFEEGRAIPQLETAESVGVRNGSFIVAPIPFSNPSLGSGLALGGAYLFRTDEASDSSTVGFGAFRSDNDSEGYAFGWDVDFNAGTWSSNLIFADADFNYDLFGQNTAVPVSQSLRGYSIEMARSLSDVFELGIGLSYGESRLRLRSTQPLPPPFQRDGQIDLARLTLRAERDLTDNDWYPTQGSRTKGTLVYGRSVDGSDRDYAKAVLATSKYWPVAADGVTAVRGTACAATDQAPFFDACAIGAVDAFRGYPATEFIDEALLSIQAEYRGRLTKRLGIVVFGGVAAVGDDFGAALGSDLKAAVGVGTRIRLSKKFPVDYSIDFSFNQRREGILYISIGQRF